MIVPVGGADGPADLPDPAGLSHGGLSDGGAAREGAALGLGAMRDTLSIVTAVAAGTDRVAARTGGVAARLRAETDRLLDTLGGGPPAELRDTGALGRDATRSLDEAAAALREAGTVLRAFARRHG